MGKTARNKLRSGGNARNLRAYLRKSNRTPVIGTSSLGVNGREIALNGT